MDTRIRVVVVSVVGIALVVAAMIVAGRLVFVRSIGPAVERVSKELSRTGSAATTASNGPVTGGDSSKTAPSPDPVDISQKSFTPASFTSALVEGGWTVTLSRGAAAEVTISAPSDIISDISVASEAGTLHLGFAHEASFLRGPMTARIITPDISEATFNGGAKVEIDGFTSDKLTVNISGAGDITARDNRIGKLEVRAAGASNVDFSRSVVNSADVYVDGAGSITLNMNGGTLGGRISGVGKVEYSGTVSVQNVQIAGLATVRHKE